MSSKDKAAKNAARLAELETKELNTLRQLQRDLTQEKERIQIQIERSELAATVTRRRAMRLAGDTFIGCRLDQRIERFFDTVRAGIKRPAVEDVVQIIDGLVARAIARRIWIAIIAVMTITPAVISLVLLGVQNETMITKLQAEQEDRFRLDRAELLSVLQANRIRWVGTGNSRELEDSPAHHRRVRAASLFALISLEKQRWSDEERVAMPPSRLVDLRFGNYEALSIGGHLSAENGKQATDLTRVRLDGGKISHARIVNVWLDGSSLREVNAEQTQFHLPSARNTDFTGMQARGAIFSWDLLIAEPFHIEKSIFDHADLGEAKFEQVLILRSSFDGTDLTGAEYKQTYFAHCDLTKAKLGNADFSTGLSGLHHCLITVEQAGEIKLPSYCRVEKTKREGVLEILSDKEKYEAAREDHVKQHGY